MSGDEADVEDQDLVEGVFQRLLAAPEPALPSTVDYAVQGGRRTLLRRRSAVGAAMTSLVAIAAITGVALLPSHRPADTAPGGAPVATTTSPSPSPMPTARQSATATPGAGASTLVPGDAGTASAANPATRTGATVSATPVSR